MVEDAAAPWSKSDGTGYANDVVVAAFKEMAVEAQLKVVPYSRCKYMVLNGQVAACFNMSWQPEFEGKIKLAARPIFQVSNDIFEHINAPLPKPPDGKCALPPGTVVGITRDYEYSAQVTALQSSGAVFENSLSDLTSLQKLVARRFQAALIMSNDLEVRNQKAKESGTEDVVRFAFNCGKLDSTIGFSLAHPDGCERCRCMTKAIDASRPTASSRIFTCAGFLSRKLNPRHHYNLIDCSISEAMTQFTFQPIPKALRNGSELVEQKANAGLVCLRLG